MKRRNETNDRESTFHSFFSLFIQERTHIDFCEDMSPSCMNKTKHSNYQSKIKLKHMDRTLSRFSVISRRNFHVFAYSSFLFVLSECQQSPSMISKQPNLTNDDELIYIELDTKCRLVLLNFVSLESTCKVFSSRFLVLRRRSQFKRISVEQLSFTSQLDSS